MADACPRPPRGMIVSAAGSMGRAPATRARSEATGWAASSANEPIKGPEPPALLPTLAGCAARLGRMGGVAQERGRTRAWHSKGVDNAAHRLAVRALDVVRRQHRYGPPEAVP